MTEEQYEEYKLQMPDFELRNPVGPFKSAYANVFENYLNLLESYENKTVNNSALSQMLPEDKDKFDLLELELKKSNVFYGGFIPPMLSNERSPFGIYIDSFLEYWKGLSKEPAYTYFTGMHGTLDYIFYQGDNLEAVRSLNVPNFYKELPFLTAPNEVIPSDHFPMVAEFILK